MDSLASCGSATGLKIEPDLGGPAEVAFEAQSGIGGDRTLAFDDFDDAAGREQEILAQDL